MLGDASGGALTAQGLVGLAALGAALRGQSAKRACINAQGAVIAALTAAPEFRTANLDRLMTLLESESAPFSRADLIAASNDAKDLDLDAALARKLHASFDFDGDDAATKRVLFLALEAGMRACNTDQEFKQDVRSVQTLQILQDIAQMKQTLAQVVTHVQTKSDLSLEARELARQEKLIHRIAEKYVEARPEDPLKALEGIEAALERLSNDIARDRRGSNFDKDFDEMIAEVDRLILEEGALDEAGQTLGRAKDDLVDRRRELAAEEKRIVEKQITVASLRNDPEAAASHYVELIALDADRPASVDEIQARALALVGPRPRTTSATPSRNLGTRAGDTDALQDAVTAYRAALEVRTREASPMDWATTQNNLGNALADLGARAGDTDALQDAVTAYRAALEVYTREASPMDWAMTQNNLGTALQTLGARAGDTDALQDAVTAYRAALEVRTREASPMDWAMTQNNLGNALQTSAPARATPTRCRTPSPPTAPRWRSARGRRRRSSTRTMENLAIVHLDRATLPDAPDRTTDLAAALDALDAALSIYTSDQTPYHHDKATHLRERILAAMNDTP
jgi:tetratricopeptide (TPR) repeat protein